MSKTSKGQQFLENYRAVTDQKIYDLVKQHIKKSESEIAKDLLKENGIKITWQNADSETNKT